jgi:hypothetical protein
MPPEGRKVNKSLLRWAVILLVIGAAIFGIGYLVDVPAIGIIGLIVAASGLVAWALWFFRAVM